MNQIIHRFLHPPKKQHHCPSSTEALELIERGVDKNTVDSKGNNALHYFFQDKTLHSYISWEMSKILEADINLSQANDQGITPFMLSASNPSHDPFFDQNNAAIFRAFVSAYLS